MSKIINKGETMDSMIRFRCTHSEKRNVQMFSKSQGVKESDFVRNAIRVYIDLIEKSTKPCTP